MIAPCSGEAPGIGLHIHKPPSSTSPVYTAMSLRSLDVGFLPTRAFLDLSRLGRSYVHRFLRGTHDMAIPTQPIVIIPASWAAQFVAPGLRLL